MKQSQEIATLARRSASARKHVTSLLTMTTFFWRSLWFQFFWRTNQIHRACQDISYPETCLLRSYGSRDCICTLMIRLGTFQRFIKRIVKRVSGNLRHQEKKYFKDFRSLEWAISGFCYKASPASQSDHNPGLDDEKSLKTSDCLETFYCLSKGNMSP